MDRNALHACIALRHGVQGLSRERVLHEVIRLLAARRAADVVAAMTHAGILGEALAGVPNPARLARVKAIEAALGRAPDAALRLAALVVQVQEDAERLRERLRLSNAQSARLLGAALAGVRLHGIDAPPDERGLRAMLYGLGRPALADGLILAQADSRAAPADERWLDAHRFVAAAPEIRLPVSGARFLALGVPAGPAVGAALKRFEAAWIAADFPDDPAAISRLVEAAAR